MCVSVCVCVCVCISGKEISSTSKEQNGVKKVFRIAQYARNGKHRDLISNWLNYLKTERRTHFQQQSETDRRTACSSAI